MHTFFHIDLLQRRRSIPQTIPRMEIWGYFTILLILGRILGFVLAADALMTARTAQGTLAWVIALILIPELAIPLYFVFGGRRFVGYVRARRKGRGELSILAARLAEALREHRRTDSHAETSRDERLAPLEKLVRLPTTVADRADLLINGEATMLAVINAINRAQTSVVAEYYIIRDDSAGQAFKAALINAANRGVKVRLIYDALGSAQLPRAYLNELRTAGIEARSFSGLRFPPTRLQINFRQHRKIVVVDGREALLGGVNIGDEYLGKDPKLSPWRDTHLHLVGPSALSVQLAWCEDWFSITRSIPDLPWQPQTPPRSQTVDRLSSDNDRTLIIPSGPADDLETCGLMFNHLFNVAKHRLWIATPYFVPDETTLHALQLAALRGVDVRVIIPEGFDARLVWLSAFAFYNDTVKAGVKLLRYQPGFMHQKVCLCDDLVAIGTANLDNRSFRLNFEITAIIRSERTRREAQAMFENDMRQCLIVSPLDYDRRHWFFRVLCRIARLMAPIQ
ncbi:MAG: cardiolipin synthase [Phycisphaerales bacterium]|nr:cardiolipin synthase [Phycisphaerales bacterium]